MKKNTKKNDPLHIPGRWKTCVIRTAVHPVDGEADAPTCARIMVRRDALETAVQTFRANPRIMQVRGDLGEIVWLDEADGELSPTRIRVMGATLAIDRFGGMWASGYERHVYVDFESVRIPLRELTSATFNTPVNP